MHEIYALKCVHVSHEASFRYAIIQISRLCNEKKKNNSLQSNFILLFNNFVI